MSERILQGNFEMKKKNIFLTVIKIIMMILTVIYSLLMVCFAGAGLIYNGDSYGSSITALGVLLIVSGIFMTAGAVLCLFRKNLPNIISIFFSIGGLALCLVMLFRLTGHADSAGWSDNYNMTPVSDMYMSRILPVIAPAVLAVTAALMRIFSYEGAEERRMRKKKKQEEENKPVPKIVE